MNAYIFFWLVVALFFLLFELSSPGLFYFLSFACGAVITALASYFSLTFFAQTAVFLISTIGALFALRKWVHIQAHKRQFHSNVHALQGKKGLVVRPATKQQFGHAHIGGELWSFRVQDDYEVAAGQQVEVLRVQGAHVIVRSAQQAG